MGLDLMVIFLFVTGFVAGIYASVVGGGTLVLVPVLSLIGTPITVAIATMRVQAIFPELASLLVFWKKGLVEWRPALWFGLWSMIGGFAGAQLIFNFDDRILSYIVAGIMVALLIVLPRLGKDTEIRNLYPRSWKRWTIFGILGLGLGFYGGFYGAGFGTFAIFIFAFLAGSSLLSGAANSRVAGFFMSLGASVIFYQHHVIDWMLLVPITAGSVIGSIVGVNFAAKFGSLWVKVLLTGVVIASVIKLVLYPG